LTIILFLLLGISGVFSAAHIPFPLHPALFVICLVLSLSTLAISSLVALTAKQVAEVGFSGTPRTRIGIATDIHRRVFVGRLGGEGSLCPICKVKLHFDQAGPTTVLRCTHNSNHWWPFDFTTVDRVEQQ
jgi:hypothetical protein